MRRAPRYAYRTEADREHQKKLWLGPVYADLDTLEALEVAAHFQVSTRLAGQIAGFIVNLNSFLDVGYVYVSHAGLARHIKNANGQPVSERQVRRVVKFLSARGYLRVEHRQGSPNLTFPLYHAPEPPGMMAGEPGHDVQGGRTSCPPNPIIKPSTQTSLSPQTPLSAETDNIVRLTETIVAQNDRSNGPANNKRAIEGLDVIHHRLARRLGYGNVEHGFESCSTFRAIVATN